MRNTRQRSIGSRLTVAFSLAASLGAATACAMKFPFQPSSYNQAAVGNVEAQLDDNGNTWVELELEHLALPATLTPPRATYVLWAESQFGRQVLLGQIKVDDDRSAAWEGTVPFDRFRLILTAEDIAWPERPRDPVALQTDYVKAKSGMF